MHRFDESFVPIVVAAAGPIFWAPRPVIWILFLLAAALVMASLSWRRVLGLLRRRETPDAILNFDGWADSTSINVAISAFGGREPRFLGIRNVAASSGATARQVRAILEFVNFDRTESHFLEATWAGIERDASGIASTGWWKKVDIGCGSTQQFLFCAAGADGQIWLYRDAAAPLLLLGHGHWALKLRVTSPNAMGFEGTMRFHVGTELVEDDPFFTVTDVIPPLQPEDGSR